MKISSLGCFLLEVTDSVDHRKAEHEWSCKKRKRQKAAKHPIFTLELLVFLRRNKTRDLNILKNMQSYEKVYVRSGEVG